MGEDTGAVRIMTLCSAVITKDVTMDSLLNWIEIVLHEVSDIRVLINKVREIDSKGRPTTHTRFDGMFCFFKTGKKIYI